MRKALLILLGAFSIQAKEIVIRADRVIDGRGKVLHNAAVVVEGTKIRPYDATATVIDALPKPKEPELDVDIQRCVLVGEKDGNPMTLRYEAVTWPHKKWNVGGGVVDTGVPPSIAAQWLVKGLVKQKGVNPPETAFDPLPYFKELSARGRGIRVVEYAEETRALN